MREWVCINDELLPAAEARVSVFDAGFLQGVGLFETMRAIDGGVFRAPRHVERLRTSAQRLGWTQIPDADLLLRHVERVLAAAGAEATRVRLTVTTGSLLTPTQQPEQAPELTVVASAASGGVYPRELAARGVTIWISDCRQSRGDPLAGHKTTSYFSRLASLRSAHARGAFEAVWLTPELRVAECAISTIFAVIDGELITPPLDTPVLPGIARAVLFELGDELGVEVREERMVVEDLLSADELFLTNVMMAVMPVVRIERAPIGNEKPGEITLRVAEALAARMNAECRDAAE